MNKALYHPEYRFGYTLIEVLVTIIVICVLAAVIFPALHQAQEAARTAACLRNVETLLVTGRVWITDNGGVIPEGREDASAINPDDYWYDHQLVPNYLPKELRCPDQADLPGLGYRYAFNDCLRYWFPNLLLPVPDSRVVFVSEMYYFGDGFSVWGCLQYTADGAETEGKIQGHFGGLNLGFLDGHAERVTPPLNSLNQPDWSSSVVYSHNLQSGYYYDDTQFACLAWGYTQW